MDAPASRSYPPAMAAGLAPGIAIAIATLIGMEVLASAVHRHVMHGWGWRWHRSHHQPGRGRLETNDLYALVFAAVAVIVFAAAEPLWPPLWWVGGGMLLYGLLYALLHDGLVHGRLGFRARVRNRYLKRLVQAHRLHHAVRDRDGAVSFGFLYAPPVRRLRRELLGRREAA